MVTAWRNKLFFTFILDFDDSMFVKTSTPGEWIRQGDYYAKHQCWKVRSWGQKPKVRDVCGRWLAFTGLVGRVPTITLVTRTQ